MTLQAGYSKVRLANVDAILNVANEIVGFINPDGSVAKIPSVATDPTSGNVTGLVGPNGSISPAPTAIYNANALIPWRRSLAKAMRSGDSRPAVIAFVGDSIVFGVQGNGSATETVGANSDGTYVGETNWPLYAQQIINSRLGKQNPTCWVAQDSRITVVGSASNVGSVGLNGQTKAPANATTMTFPATTCRRFDIYDFVTTTANSDTASGNYTYNVDASGAVAVATTGVSRVGRVTSTPFIASASHTLVITGNSAATPYITAVIASDSGGVAIVRQGRGGWSLADALGYGANNSQSTAGKGRLLSAYAQSAWYDMVLIEFAHNDAAVYSTADYSAYLDQIIAASTAENPLRPIGLISPPYPPAGQESGTYGVRTEYWDVMRDKALANANVFHARSSEAFGTAAEGLAEGMYNGGGSVHPSSQGYGALGMWLANILLPT